jgi:hypothetical protein
MSETKTFKINGSYISFEKKEERFCFHKTDIQYYRFRSCGTPTNHYYQDKDGWYNLLNSGYLRLDTCVKQTTPSEGNKYCYSVYANVEVYITIKDLQDFLNFINDKEGV